MSPTFPLYKRATSALNGSRIPKNYVLNMARKL